MSSNRASCALLLPTAADLQVSVQMANAAGYDFLVTSLVHPRYHVHEPVSEMSTLVRNGQAQEAPKEERIKRSWPFARSDLLLPCSDWSSLIVALISRPWNIEAKEAVLRRRAEEALKRELNFAGHLGLSAILLELTGPDNMNLSRQINSFLFRHGSCPQIWFRIAINAPQSLSSSDSDGSSSASADPWTWWHSFRVNCHYDKKLSLALDLTQLVSGGQGAGDLIAEDRLLRWLGEPVKAVIVNTRMYLTNKKGYPVLPRAIQQVIRRFIPLNVQVIIEGHARDHNIKHYQSYLDHLWQQYVMDDPVKQFAKGYEDFLQTPLQPLSDNLDSGTYEVFEKDPIKYAEYQRAIQKAILAKRPNDEELGKEKLLPPLTIMVLGAGRGPLVRASIQAANTAKRRIRVYAVEKNPNAIVTLLTQKEEDWGDQVEVISSDMRKWQPCDEDKADIIVSELLGSFGDNELSPECLYSAQHLFKEDAISIPTSYTSWIGPMQSSKIYNEVRSSQDSDKHSLAHFETPYVVHFQNRVEISPPKPLFTFNHPLHGPIDNNRYDSLSFPVLLDSELHGFGGYFECMLYDDVSISINPASHSKGMFSWFPIFFPLHTPVPLTKGQEIELHFWRVNNGVHVWYEWNLSKPVALPIHNPNGRSYTIGL